MYICGTKSWTVWSGKVEFSLFKKKKKEKKKTAFILNNM